MSTIIDALDNNIPVELGFQRKGKMGHVVVVIGYEKNTTGVLLYILDPGYPIVYGQYWNNVILVDPNCNKKYNAFNFVEKENIYIDEVLVIENK